MNIDDEKTKQLDINCYMYDVFECLISSLTTYIIYW